MSSNQYRIYHDKKGRLVEAPRWGLKILQRRIHKKLQRIALPQYVFTFRSAIDNAAEHYGSKEVVTLDISKFFPSTKAGRVFNLFKDRFKCHPSVCGLLTDLCTLRGHLPTGAPTSPMLSFWSYKDLWDRIDKFCRGYGCVFTVYMDDLTISGPKVHTDLIVKVCSLIEKQGLKVNESKTCWYHQTDQREVTGVRMTWNGLFEPLLELYEKQETLEKLLGEPLSTTKRTKINERLQGVILHQNQVRARQRQLQTSI